MDFNPRTPCGVRRCKADTGLLRKRFQSTHPLRGATGVVVERSRVRHISIHAPLAGCDIAPARGLFFIEKFQSTHPLRGATVYQQDAQAHDPISIHAPLAGCDFTIRNLSQTEDISIHAPLAGCDFFVRKEHFMSIFQSTHPLRGATYPRPPWPGGRHFNPRTPCGVRPHAMGEGLRISPISIHAPLAGCDAVMADEP